MHASQFNIVLPGPTDRTFVYNSFTDHCCELDAELADLYRPGAPFDGAPLPAEHESFFEADGHDEVGEYEGMLEQTLADDSELQFTIATTLACNFACSYCYQHSMQHRPSMTRATASEVAAWMLTRIACHQPERVVCKFIGGEPLLNSEAMFHILTALAQPLREADIELTLSMTTNGWFLEPALISRLQAFAPLTVVVTLDGVGDAHAVGVEGQMLGAAPAVFKDTEYIRSQQCLAAEDVQLLQVMPGGLIEQILDFIEIQLAVGFDAE